MAITAKVGLLSIAGATSTDVQPASGEVWLIKSFVYPKSDAGGPNWYFSINLWDGTNLGKLVATPNHTSTLWITPGMQMGGTSGTPTNISGYPEYAVVITNSVRLRFQNNMSGVEVYGYSGVLL